MDLASSANPRFRILVLSRPARIIFGAVPKQCPPYRSLREVAFVKVVAQPLPVRYNERKAQALEVFANHDRPITPTEWSVFVRPMVPSKWAFWYLKRLWLFGYLYRKRDFRGHIRYELSKKGAMWRLKFKTEPGFRKHVLRQNRSQAQPLEDEKKPRRYFKSVRKSQSAAEAQNRIIGIVGGKGSGKSTLTRQILERSRRLFLFDTMGEHKWVPARYDDLNKGLIFLYDDARNRDEFMGSFTPTSDDLEGEFSTCCDEVYDAGSMLFAIEEAPMLMKPQFTPPKFNRIVRLGRHRYVSLLYTAQRMAECSRGLTSATDVFVFLSQTEPRDLQGIRERCGREVAEKVQDLGRHEFLVWDVLKRRLVPSDGDWYRHLGLPSWLLANAASS